MSITALSDNEFKEKALQSKQLVIVDFWAPWCRPCKIITPILEELSQEYDSKVRICKVNIDEHQATAAKYQVLSIPTLLFFKGGKIVKQIVGLRSASEIRKVIDSLC